MYSDEVPGVMNDKKSFFVNSFSHVVFVVFVIFILILISTLADHAFCSDNLILKKLIIRASSRNESPLLDIPAQDWGYQAFRERARKLDSLLAIHTSLDSVGGRVGHERIAGMAEGFQGVGKYEKALKWWKVLYRVDREKRFLSKSVDGMVVCAVALADSFEMAKLVEISSSWPESIKRENGRYLVHMLDFLRMLGANNLWLRNKLKALYKYLPLPEAKFLDAQLAIDIGDFERAYTIYNSIMNEYHPNELDSLQAVSLLQGMVLSSFFSGREDECDEIVGAVLQYGSAPLINRARWWRANLAYISGNVSEARTLYSILCNDNIEDSCFWQEYIDKVKELNKKCRR